MSSSGPYDFKNKSAKRLQKPDLLERMGSFELAVLIPHIAAHGFYLLEADSL